MQAIYNLFNHPIFRHSCHERKYQKPVGMFGFSFIGELFSRNTNAPTSSKEETRVFGYGREMMFEAAKKGDIETLRKCVQWGVYINSLDNEGHTPLHLAALNNRPEAVKFLLGQKHIDRKAEYEGEIPMMIAVRLGYKDVVKCFFEDPKTKFEYRNRYDVSLLDLAVINDNKEMVQFLLYSRIDKDSKGKDGHTALDLAVKHDLPEIAMLLITHENEKKIIKQYAVTLFDAAKCGSGKIVKSFLENKSLHFLPRSPDRQTLLHIAVINKQTHVVSYLLRYKDLINETDSQGKTALHYAVENGDEQMVRLLLDCGIKMESKDAEGKTALHMAVICDRKKIMDLLITQGANVHATDNYGMTVLHMAAFLAARSESQNILSQEFIDQLKGKKFDLYALNKFGRTALYYAKIGTINSEPANLLEKNGIPIHGKSLHKAIQKKNVGFAEYLIQRRKTDINARDKHDVTALYYAVTMEDLVMIKLLLKNGAKINITNASGQTPLHAAVSVGNKDIVSFLIKKGADVNAIDINGKTVRAYNTEIGKNKILNIEIEQELVKKGAVMYHVSENVFVKPINLVKKGILSLLN